MGNELFEKCKNCDGQGYIMESDSPEDTPKIVECDYCAAHGFILTQPNSVQQNKNNWIKASERLPKNYGEVHWRWANDKKPASAGNAYYAIKQEEGYTIEWLDESDQPNSVQEGDGEYWKRRCEASEKLYTYHLRDANSDKTDKAFDEWMKIFKAQPPIQ